MVLIDPPSGAREGSERLLVLLAYGLFLIAPPFGGLSALAGAVIAHIRAPHAAGTIFESHYRNQIRVFWTLAIWAIAMLVWLTFATGFSLFSLAWSGAFWPVAVVGQAAAWTFFLPLAWLLSLALGIWYYWRMLRGFVRALDDKAY